MRVRISLTAALLALAVGGLAHAAEAGDALADAKAMLAAGDASSAVSTLDVYLQSNPKDTDAKFSRAVALARLKRNAEAAAAFTELTRDLPKLAQPYNNLAAVYAAQGDYVKAQAALQNALQRDPNSATTRINLGDVYTALAAIEYQRALALDGSSAAAKSRLSAVDELRRGLHSTQPVDSHAAIETSAMTATPDASNSSPVAVAASALPASTRPQPAAPAAAAIKPTPAVDEKSLIAFLQVWSQTQTKGELSPYVALYSKSFQPPKGMDRTQWLNQVTQHLELTRRSKITLKDLRWKAVPGGVLMQFQQELATGATVDHATRLLFVVPSPDRSWRIAREG